MQQMDPSLALLEQAGLAAYERSRNGFAWLTAPGAFAGGLLAGVPQGETFDWLIHPEDLARVRETLVQLIAAQKGLHHPAIDAQVALVDARLEANRKKAAA